MLYEAFEEYYEDGYETGYDVCELYAGMKIKKLEKELDEAKNKIKEYEKKIKQLNDYILWNLPPMGGFDD